ncbi:hypothetical protein Tco_0774302 [Tanacetum coccineum]|uniref:Uncharacterized protein n=1 Tax=Tanacetum coccineum TaxID=301880 RepID=A0ABQ4ZQP6_9ASTR
MILENVNNNVGELVVVLDECKFQIVYATQSHDRGSGKSHALVIIIDEINTRADPNTQADPKMLIQRDEDEDDDDDVEEEYDSDMDTTIFENEEDVSRNDSDVTGSDVAGDDDGDDDNEVDENDDDGMDTKIEDTNHADMEELDKEYNDLCQRGGSRFLSQSEALFCESGEGVKEAYSDLNEFTGHVALDVANGSSGPPYIRILSWSQRIKVALDAANTVAYLHNPEAKLADSVNTSIKRKLPEYMVGGRQHSLYLLEPLQCESHSYVTQFSPFYTITTFRIVES